MTRILKAVGTLAALSLSMGCSELIYAISPADRDQPFTIEERTDPELSLIFGTVRTPTDFLSLDEVAFVRRSPAPERQILVSNSLYFRLLRTRHIRQGIFAIPNVPPGVYELSWLRSGARTWYAPHPGPLFRVEVTDAAIYDAGALVVAEDGQLEADPAPDHISRYGAVIDASKGTEWQEPVQRLRDRVLAKGSE